MYVLFCFLSLHEFVTDIKTSPAVCEASHLDLCMVLRTVVVRVHYHDNASCDNRPQSLKSHLKDV